MARTGEKYSGFIRFAAAMIALGGLAGCGDLSDAGVGKGATPGLAITTPAQTTVNENASSEPLTVALQTAPNGDVVIAVSSSRESEAVVNRSKLTFTAQNWSLPQTLAVTGVQDHRPDGNQEVEIQFQIDAAQTLDNTGYAALAATPAGKVTVTVLDIDAVGMKLTPKEVAVAEGGANQSATFSMSLATIPDAEVVFAVSSDHPAIATVTPDRLVFDPGNWGTPQQVTVTGVNNQIADGPKATQVTLTVDPATLDTGYKTITPARVQVDVADDDIVNLSVTPRELTVRDTGPDFSAAFEVWLNTQPNGTVALDVVSSALSQAVVDKSLLTFTPSNFSAKQKVTVTAVVDSLVDGHQMIDVNVKANVAGTTDTTGYALLASKNVSVVVQDGDIKGLRVSPRDLQIDEVGPAATGSFTIMLRTRPNGTVRVNIVSSNPGEVLVNGSAATTLTITDQNWNSAQAVTVSGVNDGVRDGAQTVLLDISVDANGTTDTTGYVGLRSDVTVGVIDNAP